MDWSNLLGRLIGRISAVVCDWPDLSILIQVRSVRASDWSDLHGLALCLGKVCKCKMYCVLVIVFDSSSSKSSDTTNETTSQLTNQLTHIPATGQ